MNSINFRREDIFNKFMTRCGKPTETGCVEWIGSKLISGYGSISIDGKNYRAHRAAYAIFYGVYDYDLSVLHHCDNPICVNPKHLFLGTQQDNMQDKVDKGRNGQKLSPDDVRRIHDILSHHRNKKYVYGQLSYSAIGEMFGVSHRTIIHIAKGDIWKEINL